MVGSTVWSHFVSASSSRPVIWSGSLQCCQNIATGASISSLGIDKNHMRRGPVSREGGGWLSCSWKAKTAAQRAMCKPEHSHDAGSRSHCATCLEVWARCFPSVTSEHRNRIFHSVCPGGTNSSCTMPSISKKQININLTLLRNCLGFFSCLGLRLA